MDPGLCIFSPDALPTRIDTEQVLFRGLWGPIAIHRSHLDETQWQWWQRHHPQIPLAQRLEASLSHDPSEAWLLLANYPESVAIRAAQSCRSPMTHDCPSWKPTLRVCLRDY